MHVHEINTLAELDALAGDWRRLHGVDRLATPFVSFAWLRAWAEVSPYPWSVLVAGERAGSSPRGLLPISRRGSTATYRVDQVREIHAMGDPAADYRGLVCEPGVQDAVVRAFAQHLASDAGWDRLVFKDMLDERMTGLVEGLCIDDPESMEVQDTPGNECPLLELPATWDEYLSRCLTQPSRKSLKKRLRIAEEHAARLTVSTRDDWPEALGTLMRLAEARGKNTPEHLQRARRVLEACLREGLAEVSIVWMDSEPAAAQASFVNSHAGSIGHYLTGYDERFADHSPGRVLDAMCIARAIERGLKAVDFLRGDEPYKHQLGARPRHTRNIIVARRGAMQSLRGALSGMRERLGI